MKIWTIARREMTSYLDQPMAYVVVPGFLILSSAYLFILHPFFMVDRATMRPFFEFTPVIFTFFIPAIAMRLIAEERRSGMLNLLLSWPINLGDLVLGKFLGSAALVLVALCLTLPYALSISALGALDWGPVIGGYVGLFLLALSNLAIGLFLSALTRNQVAAFVAAFMICFGLFICGRIAPYVTPQFGQWLNFISFETHFASIARGVIDVRDITYFIGTIILFLALTTEAIRFHQWPRPIALNQAIRESGLFLVLCVSLVSIMNLSAHQGSPRFDLTADKKYTLPDAARRILSDAKAPISIQAFLPTHVQPPYSTVVTAITDKLTEYVEAAPAGIQLSIVDPSDPGLEPAHRKRIAADAKRLGVEQRELQVHQGDRLYRERVWFGVALIYKDRRQTIGPVTQIKDLDLSLTRALRDIVYDRSRQTIIGVAGGHGEPDLLNSPLATQLKETGELKVVMFQDKPIPSEIDVLIILGPRKAYSENDRYFIDQYLLRGGSVVALLDYRTPSSMFPNILVNVLTGLEPLFEAYGAHIDTRYTVLDRIQNTQSPPAKPGGEPGPNSPLYPQLKTLNSNHSITAGLTAITTPLSAPIHLDNQTWLTLAAAGDSAVLRQDVTRSDPTNYTHTDPQELTGRQPIVAAAYEGVLQSAFSRSGPPEGLNIDDDYPHLINGQSDARIFLVTSGVRMLGADKDGFILFQNAIDWAAMQTELVSIRNRSLQPPNLNTEDNTVRLIMKAGNTLGPALLCLLLGWFRKRLRAP